MSEPNKQREEIREFPEAIKDLPPATIQQLRWMAEGMRLIQDAKKTA